MVLVLDVLEFSFALGFACSGGLVGLVLLHLLEEVLLAGAFELHPLVRLYVVFLPDVGYDAHSVTHGESVVADESGHGLAHVIDLRHLDEQRDVVVEGAVVRIVVPRHDGQAALRLQHVGRGRVVNDDGIFHVSSDLGHILDEYSIDKSAMLAEESHGGVAFRIHHVHQRVRILQSRVLEIESGLLTFERLAVKMHTSKYLAICSRKYSAPGRFIT